MDKCDCTFEVDRASFLAATTITMVGSPSPQEGEFFSCSSEYPWRLQLLKLTRFVVKEGKIVQQVHAPLSCHLIEDFISNYLHYLT